MTEEKWLATLSTTEPYNNIGLIKLRRNNENSEVMRVRLTKNSKLYDLTTLKVFFVTHFTGKDSLNVPVQKEATIINAKEGIVEFIFDQDCMQKVGRQEAYFEIYDYDKFLDATQNFTYEIISSSRNMKADFTPYITTWQEAERMLDEGTAKVMNKKIENLAMTKANLLEVNKTNNDLLSRLNNLDILKMNKDGLIYQNNLSQEVKTMMTGGSVAVVGSGSVNTENLVDKASSRRKLSDYFATQDDWKSGNLNIDLEEGNRLCIANKESGSYIGIPEQLVGKTFLFKKIVFGSASGAFVLQIAVNTQIPGIIYLRFVQKNATIGNWFTFSTDSLNNGNSSDLSGKKIAFFGDSITMNGNYPEIFGIMSGATTYNVGFGGCRMGPHIQEGNGLHYDNFCMYKISEAVATGDFSKQEVSMQALKTAGAVDYSAQLNRLKQLNFSTVDIAVISYMTNDYGIEDKEATITKDEAIKIFKDATELSIKNILEVYPNVKIIFNTALWRGRIKPGDNKDSDMYGNAVGAKLIDYVDALIEVAHKNHIPVIDLYRNSNVGRYTDAFYLADQLHPNERGYKHLAELVYAGVKSRM